MISLGQFRNSAAFIVEKERIMDNTNVIDDLIVRGFIIMLFY